MISREDALQLKDRLLDVLAEDAHNADRLLARLDQISSESGISAHASLLLLLTQIAFEESEARAHWESILEHRHAMSLALQREVAVRVALFDYFVNLNRKIARPCLIDLEMLESGREVGQVDPVTGLAGDRAFRSGLQSELRRARRYRQHASVVAFDLDGFAAVNARAGRVVGDRILREAAMLLHNKIRDIDLAARPGEDELALLLPETDRNGALLVAERFRSELEVHFRRREAGGRSVDLTVSGGVASYPDDARNAEELLAHAAQALYQAKASGKNVVLSYGAERRRFLRCDLDPEGVEVEVIGARELSPSRAADLSPDGILFASPEPIDVGEEIELRLATAGLPGDPDGLRMRGRVVRLEERAPGGDDAGDAVFRFDVGVAFLPEAGSRERILEFLERARAGKSKGWV